MAEEVLKRFFKPITEKQLFEIVNHITDKRLRAYYVTLYYTGAREGEVLAIENRREDISIEEGMNGEKMGIVNIYKQRTDSKKHNWDPYVIVGPKTLTSYRQSVVDTWLIEKLQELKPLEIYFPYVPRNPEIEKREKKEGKKTLWEKWLVLRTKGIIPKRPLTKEDLDDWESLKKKGIIPEEITLRQVIFPYEPREVRRIWEELREKGIVPEGISLNHFRRSRETDLINSGYPPVVVANMIGHTVTTKHFLSYKLFERVYS